MTQGREEIRNGNYRSMTDVLYGIKLKPGIGGLFERKSANKALGLEEENLDIIIRKAEMN